jgi:hypothetical protein
MTVNLFAGLRGIPLHWRPDRKEHDESGDAADCGAIVRVHSDVSCVDLLTLLQRPGIHADTDANANFPVIPEDAEVKVLRGPLRMAVGRDELVNFLEVSYGASGGCLVQGWVPETFLIFR